MLCSRPNNCMQKSKHTNEKTNNSKPTPNPISLHYNSTKMTSFIKINYLYTYRVIFSSVFNLYTVSKYNKIIFFVIKHPGTRTHFCNAKQNGRLLGVICQNCDVPFTMELFDFLIAFYTKTCRNRGDISIEKNREKNLVSADIKKSFSTKSGVIRFAN